MKHFILGIFITLVFASSAVAQKGCFSDYDLYVYGWTYLLHQDVSPQLVSGLSGTELIVFGYVDPYCEDFDAGVRSTLRNESSGQILSSGSLASNGYFIEGQHDTFYANSGNTYCVNSDHGFVYWWATEFGWYSKVHRVLFFQECYTFPPPPTPTPTPTPPCFTCQDIQATIGAIEIIEKYNVLNVPITVSNATETNGTPLTTTFSLRTTAGTGNATFEDGSTSVSVQGNVTNQNLRIKGVTESSQVDNLIIEAKFTNPDNNTTRVLVSDRFTVATITALEFERIDTSYTALDANPGTDGVANPNGSEGQRIYPDKISVADVTATNPIDRSLVKVNATIAPEIPNLTVYFASFDLDDPSTNTTIDTNGVSGNENNGVVVNSKSGAFVNPANSGRCSASIVGTPTNNHISTISCSPSTETPTIVTTDYKVTMQPGDNFAVAASLTEDYRNGIVLDINDGSRLRDASNNELPTARASGNEVVGIRTQMLTVWRKLHIEVDSMGLAKENYVRGNIDGSYGIAAGATRTINVTAPNLETNRFENGRLELAWITNYFDVVSNTNNTVTIKNTTSNSIVIDSGVNFQILNQGVTRSGFGTVSTGQTVAPGDSVTININSRVPLETNLFSNGSLFITPTLNSLTVVSNTATSLEVKNNSRRRISIEDATFFRLYDDDDMNDDAPPVFGGGKIVDGDEGDDVPEPDMSLLQDSDLPANNVFAPAYIRPECCLTGSRENVPFVANIQAVDFGGLDPYLSQPYFNNFGTEASEDFWTIYLLGGYQPKEFTLSSNGTRFDTDGDPKTVHNGLIDTSYAAANASNVPGSRFNDGYGAVIYIEVGRPTEYPNDYLGRPVSVAHTTAHEVGHLFKGIHNDGGLMGITASRQTGTFSDISLSIIRGTTHP